MKFRLKLAILVAGVTVLPVMVMAFVLYLNGVNLLQFGLFSPKRFFALKHWLDQELPEAWQKGSIEKAIDLLPVDEDIVVLDPAGRIVLSTDPRFVVGVIVTPTQLYTASMEADTRRPGVHHPIIIEGHLLGVVVQFPPVPQDLAARISLRLEGFLVYLGVVLVAAILIIAAVTRSLRRGIGSLDKAAARVASGDLNFKITPRGNDEITALTRSFESMRLALKEDQARRSRFLMAVSHDLKTPLTAIEGYIEAILDGLASEPQTLQSHLTIIADKSKLLETRINELIDYVKMSTGQWKLRHCPIKIRHFLTELGQSFQTDATIFHRQFECRIDLPEELELLGDRDLLMRAVDNLFHNALRYTEEGDSIGLFARRDGAAVEIVFQDSGPGIAEEKLELIFEPFFRGSSSRREAGSGLGLSTVRSVIEAHGWSIQASVSAGKGLTFTIRALQSAT